MLRAGRELEAIARSNTPVVFGEEAPSNTDRDENDDVNADESSEPSSSAVRNFRPLLATAIRVQAKALGLQDVHGSDNRDAAEGSEDAAGGERSRQLLRRHRYVISNEDTATAGGLLKVSAEAAIDEGKAAEQRQRAQEVAATDAAWTSTTTAADEEGEEGGQPGESHIAAAAAAAVELFADWREAATAAAKAAGETSLDEQRGFWVWS